MEEDAVSEELSSCELCGQDKLSFVSIYCRPCGLWIKQNAIYYSVDAGSGYGSTGNYFCVQCYNEDAKLSLHEKKTDEEIEELWIQCDKCKVRQHQICAMFNGRRNDGSSKAEYTCTNCAEEPLLHDVVLGAVDLPRTVLSDQIEQRLSRLLKQERQERARLEGKVLMRRGFTSCYIRACPPTDDYIFYCPGVQKTLKPDKRREWYLAMLRKASNEKIVVDLTNLFDHFFVPTGECKAKATAARLPYFNGDYWPVVVEDLIHEIHQEGDGQKLDKKGNTEKTVVKRALEESGHSIFPVNR